MTIADLQKEYGMTLQSLQFTRKSHMGSFEFNIFVINQVYSALDQKKLLGDVVCKTYSPIKAFSLGSFLFFMQKLEGARKRRPLKFFPQQQLAVCPSGYNCCIFILKPDDAESLILVQMGGCVRSRVTFTRAKLQ